MFGLILYFIFCFLLIAFVLVNAGFYIYGLWRVHNALSLPHPQYSLIQTLNVWQIVELMVAQEEDDCISVLNFRIPYHVFILGPTFTAIFSAIPVVGAIITCILSVVLQKTFISKTLCLLNGESTLDTSKYERQGWTNALLPILFGLHMKNNWRKYAGLE